MTGMPWETPAEHTDPTVSIIYVDCSDSPVYPGTADDLINELKSLGREGDD
jgi:hypothetical protein